MIKNLKDKLVNHWLTRSHSQFHRFSGAVILSALSLLLNYFLRIQTDRNLLFLSLASIVTVSSLYGYGPGLLATILTSLGFNYLLINDISNEVFQPKEVFLRISIYFTTGILMTGVGGTLRYALHLFQEAKSEAENSLNSRDEFISIVSHELKSPLTSLKLRIQRNLRLLNNSENIFDRKLEIDTMNHLLQTVNKAERLVFDLQDFSRIVHKKLRIEPEEIELSEITEQVVARFEDEFQLKNIKFTMNIPNGLIGFWDSMRIEQVISNLISNAIKYGNRMPVELEARPIDEDKILISVRDHGPGIQKSDMENVFTKFERINPSNSIVGLGLGLYITKTIVELHKGTIRVAETPGGGATFNIVLPSLIQTP